MLNFGWAEMIVIGVVALIVIGPEDLPDMFRQLGRFTGKLRSMSREFSRAMEQAAKESGVKDVAKDLKSATSAKSLGLDAVKSAADKFEKWDPIKNAAKPTNPSAVGAKPLVPPPMPATPKPEAAAAAAEDLDEEVEDLLLAGEEAAAKSAAPAVGPATQALYDKKALRAQVLAEQAQKLRAIEAGTYMPGPAVTPEAPTPDSVAAPASKPRKAPAKAKGTAGADKPTQAAKPAAKPRKTSKKADV